MPFINRQQELFALETKWKESHAQLFIVYGKRRVGKTELMKQFMKGKPAIYFLADKRTSQEQLRELGRMTGAYFQDTVLERHGFRDWMEMFQFLKDHVRKNFLLIFDEYPYLVKAEKAISSLFQKGWDEYLKDTKIFLVLLGSSVSMMESETLLYQSPLYGRRTGQLLLKPLSFYESWKFFPKKDFASFLSFYAVTGGMPAYLLQMDPRRSLQNTIQTHILQKTAFLHNEVEFLLKEELREPKNYLSILRAIAWGKTRLSEIANETGLEKNVLTKYLSTLERLQFIEKEVPVTEKQPLKSRRGIYKLFDPFVRFWFQYVFPYKSLLEIEQYAEVQRKIKESFSMLVAAMYEKVCQEILWRLRNDIFPFERVGRWWEKNAEIDVIGFNKATSEIVFGEAKWSVKPVGMNILEDLKKKAKQVVWQSSRRKEYYILFSKSGFTPDIIDYTQKHHDVFLVERDTLLHLGKNRV